MADTINRKKCPSGHFFFVGSPAERGDDAATGLRDDGIAGRLRGARLDERRAIDWERLRMTEKDWE